MGTHRISKTGIQDVVSRAMGDPLPVSGPMSGPAVSVTHESPNRDVRSLKYLPSVDVKETWQEYAIYVDLPGIDEDALKFHWEGKSLLMSGFRDFDHDREDAEEFVRLERPYGEFQCRIDFQEEVDADQATAKYKRGVLKVRLPKRDRFDRSVSLT